MKKYMLIIAVLLAISVAGCSTKSVVHEETLYDVPVIHDVLIDCGGLNTKSSYSDCTHTKGRPSHYPY